MSSRTLENYLRVGYPLAFSKLRDRARGLIVVSPHCDGRLSASYDVVCCKRLIRRGVSGKSAQITSLVADWKMEVGGQSLDLFSIFDQIILFCVRVKEQRRVIREAWNSFWNSMSRLLLLI